MSSRSGEGGAKRRLSTVPPRRAVGGRMGEDGGTGGGRPSPDGPPGLAAVAGGVHVLEVGGGILRSNVYFVGSASGWVLIDAGPAGCEDRIRQVADVLFQSRPAAVLLTHIHPDHSGSAPGLARDWDCPVYVHPDELRFAVVDASTYFSTYEPYSNGNRSWRPPGLDRCVLLPLMHVLPRGRREKLIGEQSLRGRVHVLDAGGAVPGLPDWEAVPTPGHTPGHVSFFRPSDRLLITGDAVVTVELNSLAGLFGWALGRRRLGLSGPPRYFTWSRSVAGESIATLARLRPSTLAPGHGPTRAGPTVADELLALAPQVRGARVPSS